MNYKQLTQKNRKYFIVLKELKASADVFSEQLFKCVKIIFSQIYPETGRIKTKTSKGTAISIFSEYFIYFIIFYQFDNFM